MDLDDEAKLKRFIIRVIVTTLSILTILFFVKIWFVNNKSNSSRFKQNAPLSITPLSISLNDVTKYYGKYVVVEGKITKTHNSGKACFLNFVEGYKRYFTAVIFASSFSRFPPNPENYYLNKIVRVTGTIKEYKGSPEIILNSKEYIEVVK